MSNPTATSKRNTKTDNRSLPLKLKIRRWTIRKAGIDRLRVLDLCAGEGHIWRAMAAEYPIDSYTPCDRQPRMPAVIKGEAERLIESFDLSLFNLIDVDTYGEPWECWLKLLPRLRHKTAVLLTHGTVAGKGGSNTSAFALQACGVPAHWPYPKKPDLARFVAGYCLELGAVKATIHDAARVVLPRVTYYGLVASPPPASAGEPAGR